MVKPVAEENLPDPEQMLKNLQSAGKNDAVILSFLDGRQLRGGLLVNPIQRTGLLFDLDTETRTEWRLEEIADVKPVL
jgi:hypothetical protein